MSSAFFRLAGWCACSDGCDRAPDEAAKSRKPRPSPSRMFILRHAHVVEPQVHGRAAAWSWPNTHGPEDLSPGGPTGTRSATAACWAAHRDWSDHHDHDLAAGIAEAGNVILPPLMTHSLPTSFAVVGCPVLGVGRSDVRLGHRVGGTDFAALSSGFSHSPSFWCRHAPALPCCRCRAPSSSYSDPSGYLPSSAAI